MRALESFNVGDWYFCASHRGYTLRASKQDNTRYIITQATEGGQEVIAEYPPGGHSAAVADFDALTREPWL